MEKVQKPISLRQVAVLTITLRPLNARAQTVVLLLDSGLHKTCSQTGCDKRLGQNRKLRVGCSEASADIEPALVRIRGTKRRVTVILMTKN
jgi:hypothetical protein